MHGQEARGRIERVWLKDFFVVLVLVLDLEFRINWSISLFKVEEEITEVRSTLKACKGEAVKESTKAWSMELRERKAREMNIILYGLAKLLSTNTRGEDRKQHDTTKYTNMLTEIGCNVSMEDKVKFLKTLSTREDIFSKARGLPQCSYSEVSIAQDLTKLQREEEKELGDEAARLTDEQSESDF